MTKHPIWFRAKRYGYGWGLPVCWQGWVVLIAYLLLVVGGAKVLLGGRHAAYFVLWTTGLSVLFVLVCVFRGEAPRWRWGDK